MQKSDEVCRQLGLQTRDPINKLLSLLLYFYGNQIKGVHTFLWEKRTKCKTEEKWGCKAQKKKNQVHWYVNKHLLDPTPFFLTSFPSAMSQWCTHLSGWLWQCLGRFFPHSLQNLLSFTLTNQRGYLILLHYWLTYYLRFLSFVPRSS